MRAIFLSSVTVFSFLVVAACGGNAGSVGDPGTSGEQKLQTKKDGSATGNGSTCSWEGTSTYDAVASSAPDAPVPGYALGDEFKSIDGCNECACTAKGIMCTVRACTTPPSASSSGSSGEACPAITRACMDDSPAKLGAGCKLVCPEDQPQACDASARICKDGSTAKRGENCQQICPEDSGGGGAGCSKELKICPDGKTGVARVAPSCEFAPCPSAPPSVACTADAKKCPDGSYVGRTGPSCEFAPCK